jgi:hypothetical protein
MMPTPAYRGEPVGCPEAARLPRDAVTVPVNVLMIENGSMQVHPQPVPMTDSLLNEWIRMLFLAGPRESNEPNEEERGYTDRADQKKRVNQPR